MNGMNTWAEGPSVDSACPNENCSEHMIAVRYPATMGFVNHLGVVDCYFDLPMRCSACGSLYPPANEGQLHEQEEMTDEKFVRLVKEGRVRVTAVDEESAGLIVKMQIENTKTPVERMREESGHAVSNDRLVMFLYLLARDWVPTGTVDKIVDYELPVTGVFTNGWLARWAEDVVKRLRADTFKGESAARRDDLDGSPRGRIPLEGEQ